ncbi:MAG: hypothetical protein B6U97_03700 [Candidatus Altiarchaeales archaeon ex4484_96]|nr:MAG: hypothetical protein B6U97_03700 [Candidatus Altiarchaeales archaeon ex4484_96]
MVKGKFRLVGGLAALSLVLSGLITYYVNPQWQDTGFFISGLGLFSILLFVLDYYGLFSHPLVKKIDNIFKDRETALDDVTKIGLTAYLVALLYVLVRYNLRIMPDQIILLGVFAAALMGRTRKFLSDWLPFTVLIFAYDSMRGVSDNIGFPINYQPLINLERFFFLGNLPTIELQKIFYTPGLTQWYDVIAMNVYFLHFTPAVLFAAFLWASKGKDFTKFRDSMLLVSYAALVTFMLFPASPPWMAHDMGFIKEDLYRIRLEIETDYLPTTINTIYYLATSNTVAAMPSLHAAYPWLVFLYARKRWGVKGYAFIPLPLSIGLAAVYLGEHYVIDICAGFIYATAAHYFSNRLK